MLTRLDYIENQSRRSNIVADGIADEKEENWNESEKKVRQMFSSNLGLNDTKMDIERGQRICPFQEGGQGKLLQNFCALKMVTVFSLLQTN